MTIDPTTLKAQADDILALLEEQADAIPWNPARSCVTNGPPSVECDSLFVWADAITPIKESEGANCHVVLRARFQYVVAVCVGTIICDATGASLMHDTAWGVQAGFVQAVLSGELCASPCSSVRFGDFTLLTNDGGYSWWQGSIQVDLSPEVLAEGAVVSPESIGVEGGA